MAKHIIFRYKFVQMLMPNFDVWLPDFKAEIDAYTLFNRIDWDTWLAFGLLNSEMEIESDTEIEMETDTNRKRIIMKTKTKTEMDMEMKTEMEMGMQMKMKWEYGNWNRNENTNESPFRSWWWHDISCIQWRQWL